MPIRRVNECYCGLAPTEMAVYPGDGSDNFQLADHSPKT